MIEKWCRHRKLRMFQLMVGLGLLAGALLCYSFFIEPYLLVVRHYQIQVQESGEERVRLVQISDLQLGENYSLRQLRKVVNKIQKQHPDMIIFSGDLFEDYKICGTELEEDVTALLGELEAPLGKYAVWGNRDYGGGAERAYRRIMQASGFHLLCNAYETVQLADGQKMLLCGLDDSLFGKPDSSIFAEFAGQESSYRILLLHEPDVAQLLSYSDFHLILAGHSHGGQVRLPFFGGLKTVLAQEYVRQFYTLNEKTGLRLYVNTGLGTSHLAVRFGVPPEIAVFEIQL